MNIVVSNVKGGVGKTTTSVYLAAAAARRGRGPVLLVDADPQGSTAEWYEVDPLEGVELVEGPSVRTVTKAMSQDDGHRGGRHPAGGGQRRPGRPRPGRRGRHPDPGRRGRAEPGRHDPGDDAQQHPGRRGHLLGPPGTNDLEATVEWWTELKVPVWGIIPERVSIASGPAAALSTEGLEHYGKVLKKATAKNR